MQAGFTTIYGQIIPYIFTGYRFHQNNHNYLVGVGLDISERIKTENEKENLIKSLHEALAEVK